MRSKIEFTLAMAAVVALGLACGGPERGEVRARSGESRPLMSAARQSSDASAQWEGALFDRELEPEIRVWVVRQVAQIPTPSSTDLLIRVLEEPEIPVVRAAVKALAGRRDPRSYPALEKLRAHPDPVTTRLVGEILDAR